MSTYERIHLYVGCNALGIEKQGFGKPKTFNGKIGPSTLTKLQEQPLQFEVRPYLKPLEAVERHDDMRDALIEGNGVAMHMKTETYSEKLVQHLRYTATIANVLRERGWDVDGLIDRGLAFLDKDYDAKSLL